MTTTSSSATAPGVGNGARSVMASRIDRRDSLDFYPTPPWATRALVERALPHVGVNFDGVVWEPACGEGHMSDTLAEYVPVIASDIASYREGQMVQDFLNPGMITPEADWIITNPPFGDRTLQFVFRGLDLAHVGIAMFVRSQWAIEGIERYERIFRPHPPTCFAPFVERVPLCKARWGPGRQHGHGLLLARVGARPGADATLLHSARLSESADAII
jgi:hypothetical protein